MALPVGRPSFINLDEDLTKLREFIDFWREQDVSFDEIARKLNIERRTLFNWRQKIGYVDPMRTPISEQELDTRVMEYCRNHPNRGEVMIDCCLKTDNIFVSMDRIRDSLHRVDSDGVMRRKNLCRNLKRREYNVHGPHHLWHLDGNLKLSQFHLVVHAAIDGYSRCATFVHCSDNNRATTVLDQFRSGVDRYMCPSRVRTDKGKENIEVGRFMLSVRGLHRGSIITGRSMQNQRIERFWRDVYKEVLQLYREMFTELKIQYSLDLDNPYVLFCLHYLFLNRINDDLELFRQRWNNHKLRTEHNKSPNQLLILNQDKVPNPPLQVAIDEYGAEYDTDYERNDATERFEDRYLEPLNCPISTEQFTLFSNEIAPLHLSDDDLNLWGTKLIAAIHVLGRIVEQ